MRQKKPVITITKIDAVFRQLFTALSLYFQDGEPASIHTLVCAALGILRPINKAIGKSPMGLDEDLLPPILQTNRGRAAFWRDDILGACNFLKHGSSNPLQTFDLRPDQTEQLLLDAVVKHREVSGSSFALGACFLFYMALMRSELFEPDFSNRVRQLLGVDDVAGISRQEFLKRHQAVILATKDKKTL